MSNVPYFQSMSDFEPLTPSKVAALANAVETLVKTPASAVTYKSYVALITQTGTNAPVATVLENTLGGTVVWSRDMAGAYIATLTGAFPANKTVYNNSSQLNSLVSGTTYSYYYYRVNNNSFELDTLNGDGNLSNALFEIRVYN